jgi:uncharacterized protein
MLDFQRYQQEFTAHIRNPSAHKKPAGIVPARMAVYREAVFNNIFESVSVCFPVCRAAIGKRAWRALLKDFVKSYPAQSPIFREIPQQFLHFLSTLNTQAKPQPAFLAALAHYEWVELAVSAHQTEPIKLSKKPNWLAEKPVLTPAHMLLEYDFAVHKITKGKLPKTTEKTYLLVFRNAEFEVKFIELNPTTFQLLQLIEKNETTGRQALIRLAEVIQHPDVNAVIAFGAEILSDLAHQQAIIGSAI